MDERVEINLVMRMSEFSFTVQWFSQAASKKGVRPLMKGHDWLSPKNENLYSFLCFFYSVNNVTNSIKTDLFLAWK